MAVRQTVRALFVAWQQPLSRRYFPVGRLVHGVGDASDLYEFSYIHGAWEARKEGFHPFLAFPGLETVYSSRDLFPFFTNRLMSRNRPDFGSYVERLGLSPDADALTILGRSGGVRATDSIEMFPMPICDAEIGRYQTYFWAHGVRHHTPQEQARLLQLQPGERLQAVHEPTNPADSNALRLVTEDRVFIGYVPRYVAGDASRLLGKCQFFEVFAVRVNPEPAPIQQRLLCELQSGWPDDFVPCDAETYQPISDEACTVNPCTGVIESR